MDSVPLDRLDREWQALVSGQLAARFQRWAEEEPGLAAFAGPGALIRFLHGPGATHDKDTLLGSLLERARAEPLAARVVLQALRPGLKRLAGRLILDAGERQELWELLLASAWEKIRTYPLERRPRRIAANLLLDTMHATLAELARERAFRAELPLSALSAPVHAPEPDRDVEAPLARALAAGAISSDEAELILRTRLDGRSLAAIAKTAGVPYITLYMRRHRAERRLLLFLGSRAVKKGRRNRPSLSARASGAQAACRAR